MKRPTGFALAPWHMWGATQVVRLTPVAGDNVQASLQLLRVNYKRPETWSFFFGASLYGAGTLSDALTVRVAIDVITGVGRSVFNTENQFLAGFPQFVTFFWNLAGGQNLTNVARKWTTTGSRVHLDDTDATDTVRPEWIVAEQLQAKARIFVVAETTEPELKVEVTGFVAPRTHVRPEWFDDNNMFRGQETGGT